MSRVKDLISSHCPDGVRHTSLGEVATFRRGTTITNTMATEGTVPVIAGGRQPAYLHGESNRHGETIAVAGSGAYAGHVTYWSKPVFVSDAFTVHPDPTILVPRYVYHFLKSVQVAIHTTKTGGGVPHVKGGDIAPLRIPVPPLEVQREIVRILDEFTQLEAELEAELEARRRQYEHIAGRLLAHGTQVPRARFGDVARIVRGASPRPIQKFLTDQIEGIPWIKIGDAPARGKYITQTDQRVTTEGASKSRLVRPGDFVLSNSMSYGRPYISKIEGCIHDGWLAISEFEDTFVPDYLYYLLRSSPVQEEFARRAGAGTVKNLNAEIVRSITIPLPSREAQEEVVELLDQFDALVNDLSVGLPAELAARRKQYEYYRDRLLTFEEAG